MYSATLVQQRTDTRAPCRWYVRIANADQLRVLSMYSVRYDIYRVPSPSPNRFSLLACAYIQLHIGMIYIVNVPKLHSDGRETPPSASVQLRPHPCVETLPPLQQE